MSPQELVSTAHIANLQIVAAAHASQQSVALAGSMKEDGKATVFLPPELSDRERESPSS